MEKRLLFGVQNQERCRGTLKFINGTACKVTNWIPNP